MFTPGEEINAECNKDYYEENWGTFSQSGTG